MDKDLAPEETEIAPMLVQPLVENAIWHGLRNKEGERKLFISFLKDGDQIVCEVEDNGVGLHRTIGNNSGSLQKHNSYGIKNIRERLTILNEKYKMNCSLNIKDKIDLPGKDGSGTLAILQLSS
jgi:sensor histidine kinase YesM